MAAARSKPGAPTIHVRLTAAQYARELRDKPAVASWSEWFRLRLTATDLLLAENARLRALLPPPMRLSDALGYPLTGTSSAGRGMCHHGA